MKNEFKKELSERIINQLKTQYPRAKVYDLDGRGKHFVAEVEPTKDHRDYDRAVEVILSSKPHKHLKMTQYYRVISGELELHVEDKIVRLKKDDKYVINPNTVHWAKGKKECWIEIYSKPGWTEEDHISVNLEN